MTPPVYCWISRHGLPILMVDPMPDLGGYFNQRAMLNAWPHPVWWMPLNWFTVPITATIEFAKHVVTVLRSAK